MPCGRVTGSVRRLRRKAINRTYVTDRPVKARKVRLAVPAEADLGLSWERREGI
jgi:hypothetical protein